MNRYMIKIVTVCLVLFLALQYVPANAQKDLYPNACSIVENAETEVIYNSSADVVCKERRTVTVFNEKGKGAANFHSAYNEKYSSLRKFSGTVTDSNGKVIRKLKKSDLQSNEYSAELASDVYRYFYMYAPSQYPFTITYEWEEKYTGGLIGLPTFLPQQEYNQAVIRASYRLLTPSGVPCRYHAINCQADISQQPTEDGKQLTQVLINNLPPISREPFSPKLNELLPRVYFVPETFTFDKTSGRMDSWKNYGVWQYGLLKDRDYLPQEFIQKLKEMTADCKTDRERVQTIYDYLASTTRYVSIQLGIGGLQPMPAADVHRTGFGDCKGLSNYTRAMLSALGIPSYYTVISTDNERFLPDFASANQANHVILQVPLPGDTLWLECTNPKLPLGYVHHSIAGHDALLIKPEGGILHRLPTYADSLCTQVNKAIIVLAPDGKAYIDVCQRSRLFQYEDNWGLNTIPPNKQKDYLRSSINLVQAEVDNIRYNEQKQQMPSMDIFYNISSNQYGSQTGKRLFLPTNIFHRSFYTSNESTERTQDILIEYGYVDTDSIQIQLPDGYTIESLPTATRQETAFGTFSTSLQTVENNIHIVHQLFMKRGRYPKEKYGKFLEFRKEAAKQYNSKIIIRKKE